MFYLPIGFDGDETEPKTYTQEEFDRHMGGIRKKYETTIGSLKSAQEQLADQLKAAQSAPGLADEERQALQAQIESLESQYMTKQQLAEKAALQKEKTLQDQIAGLTESSTQWKTNYQNEVTRNQIYLESSKHEAHDPETMSRMLGPDITWKEVEREDGNGTSFEPRVSFTDTDKDGKPVILELTVGQAMARMKELPERFGHLFKGELKAGIGGVANTGTAGGQQITQKMLSRDPALLRKIMKEQPELLKNIPAM
jgi:ribosomal protein L11 methylase PrmA